MDIGTETAATALVDDQLRKQYNGRALFLRLQAAAMIRKGYRLAHIVKKTLLSMEALDDLQNELRLVDVTRLEGGTGLDAGKAATA